MLKPDGSLSDPALRLIGGLCHYADSLTAFGNTTSSAYLRLVPNQEPDIILERLSDHLREHLPPGVRVRIDALPGRARAYKVPADHPGNRAAAAVLTELYGREPYHVRSGGTIPVTGILRDHVGMDTISFGFALPDENIHSPDEFFRLDSFRRAQEGYARLLEVLPRFL